MGASGKTAWLLEPSMFAYAVGTILTCGTFSAKSMQSADSNEPPHDKTNKIICGPRKDSDQPGHLPSLISVLVVRMKKTWVLSYPLSIQWRLWLDWADSQADLSLRWEHMPFFFFFMRRLIDEYLCTASEGLKLFQSKSVQLVYIKTTHGRTEIWSLFTGGLYLVGQFQRFTNKCLQI